ncbi:MAG: response regulator transcription factor [Bacteroidetes bacterium]|nr:response regulator transcription factor [Bacteroidota bacterium]
MEKIKVLLVDDHDIVMDGISSILAEASDINVVGKASSLPDARMMLQKYMPDLVITDISLGDKSGVELTKYITAGFPGIKVLVLTMHDSVQHITSMLEAGAHGYLIKNIKQDELLLAIGQVMNGERYIQQSVAAQYRQALQRAKDRTSVLSPREIEVMRLIVQGYTSAQIGKQLFLSELTVDTHRKNISRKTGVKSAIALLNYAREHGLL